METISNNNIYFVKNSYDCYICLEPVNYYWKFECECYNFFHIDCFTNYQINYCLICKNKLSNLNLNHINNSSNIYNKILNLTLTETILSTIRIHKLFEYYIHNLKNNISNLESYFIISIITFFLIFLPIIMLNITLNILIEIKNNIITTDNFFVSLDYIFLICVFIVPIFILTINFYS